MSYTRSLVLVGAALALTAGCSSGGSAVSTAQKGAPAGDMAAGKPVAGNPAAPVRFQPQNRSLVFTGTVTVRVSNVDQKAAEATTIATAAGGFVGGDSRTNDKDRSQATLTLRVPSARFTNVVDDIGRLGKPEGRKLSTEDVTDQVVDVDARIATGQASVNRVRELLARAQTIGEIVSLESELSRREADLESLKSRKRTLDDQTTLSTVTAVLLGPEAASAGKPGETGFLAGLKAGWRAFVESVQVLLTVLGALLPWLVALGIPLYAAWWLLRRARRRTAPAAAE